MYLSSLKGRFGLEKPSVVIGRDALCDVSVADVRVSRRHALIARTGDVHLLADLQSSNGTFLNGVRLKRSHVMLRPGDTIEVGDTTLVYGAPAVAKTAAALTPLALPVADLAVAGDVERELAAVAAALSGTKGLDSVETALERVSVRLDAPTAAIFVRHPTSPKLLLMAARPSLLVARALEEAASACVNKELALVLPLGAGDGTVTRRSCGQAAVPLAAGDLVFGALVIERHVGEPLGAKDLAELAVLGSAFAAFLARESAKQTRERTGFGVLSPVFRPRPTGRVSTV